MVRLVRILLAPRFGCTPAVSDCVAFAVALPLDRNHGAWGIGVGERDYFSAGPRNPSHCLVSYFDNFSIISRSGSLSAVVAYPHDLVLACQSFSAIPSKPSDNSFVICLAGF